MATITVDFDGLEDLAPSEVNAGLLCFTEARDRYAREGRAGMAALYNAMAIVLDEVREQRKQAAKNISIHLLDIVPRGTRPGERRGGFTGRQFVTYADA
jgi:hypothetical protein